MRRISIVALCRSVRLRCRRGRRRSEVTVFQPHFFRRLRGFIGDGERRDLRVVQQADVDGLDLDLAVFIFGFTASAARATTFPFTEMTNSERNRFTLFTSGSLSRATTCVRPWRSRRSMKTNEPRSRMQVHPTEQDDVPADVRRRQFAVGVGARGLSEWFDVHFVRCPLSEVRCPRSVCPRSVVRGQVRAGAEVIGDGQPFDNLCSPVVMFFTVTTPRARSSPPSMVTNFTPREAAYLNCFPSLSDSGYTSTRRAGGPQVGVEFQRFLDRLAFEQRDQDVRRGRREVLRKHIAFGHDHQDPLEPQRKAARRYLFGREHPDQAVVRPRHRDYRRGRERRLP